MSYRTPIGSTWADMFRMVTIVKCIGKITPTSDLSTRLHDFVLVLDLYTGKTEELIFYRDQQKFAWWMSLKRI